MATWHEVGAQESLRELVAERGLDGYAFVETARQVLWCDEDECAHQIECGIFGQVPNDSFTIEQLHAFGFLEMLRLKGSIRRIAFDVKRGPAADVERAENREVLRAALSDRGLTVDVYDGHGHEQDGSISWCRDLPLKSHAEAIAETTIEASVPPGSAPLEIGYTKPSRTVGHIGSIGAVWRWPYDSHFVWLCANVRYRPEGWRIRPIHPSFGDTPWP